MLGRTVFAAAFFALAQFAVATPPGCLLGAVNQFKDPSDLKAVCSAKDLSEKVSGICGGDAQTAMEALADICNGAGVKLCKLNPFPKKSMFILYGYNMSHLAFDLVCWSWWR